MEFGGWYCLCVYSHQHLDEHLVEKRTQVLNHEGGVVRRFNIYPVVLFILLLPPLIGCVHTRSIPSRSPGASYPDPLEIHFIDVGQGETILIRSPFNEAILIDAGPLSSGYLVMHYLTKLNIKKIDTMIVTHMHQDHAGGLFHFLIIISSIDIELPNKILIYFKTRPAATRNEVKTMILYAR